MDEADKPETKRLIYKDIIEYAMKAIELRDLVQRIETIEDHLKRESKV